MRKIKTIDAIRKFFKKECSYIDKKSKLCVDFLSNDSVCFSIEPVPVEPIVEEYIDGGRREQFVFVLACMFPYNDEFMNNIDNSGFFETIQDWLEECTENGVFPKLDSNYSPVEIKAITSGYLFGVSDDMSNARYQIQCRFLYDKEGE